MRARREAIRQNDERQLQAMQADEYRERVNGVIIKFRYKCRHYVNRLNMMLLHARLTLQISKKVWRLR